MARRNIEQYLMDIAADDIRRERRSKGRYRQRQRKQRVLRQLNPRRMNPESIRTYENGLLHAVRWSDATGLQDVLFSGDASEIKEWKLRAEDEVSSRDAREFPATITLSFEEQIRRRSEPWAPVAERSVYVKAFGAYIRNIIYLIDAYASLLAGPMSSLEDFSEHLIRPLEISSLAHSYFFTIDDVYPGVLPDYILGGAEEIQGAISKRLMP